MASLKVFVSHSHADNAFCRQLVQALRTADADVWYDEQDMERGQLTTVIQRELDSRSVFIVILSKPAFASKWVRQETTWAYILASDDSNRIILPVTATPIDRNDFKGEHGWLFLLDYKRIEAENFQPFPIDETIRRTLSALGLAQQSNPPQISVTTNEHISFSSWKTFQHKPGSSSNDWIAACAELTKPERVRWWNGTNAEFDELAEDLVQRGDLIRLNETLYPNCFLGRSSPQDVARTEQLTFVCPPDSNDAGPTNNWMHPDDARSRVLPLFDGSMRGRTMYVIPYLLGVPGSIFAKAGIEITDSPYAVLNMHQLTRVGQVALDHIRQTGEYTPGLHSLGDLNPSNKFLMHFPDENLIWSIGSGYGSNALLSKTSFSLRMASIMGHREGWLAEHMLILGLEDPRGQVTYIAAAMPSAGGKTNLSMLISPLANEGYRVWTVGDDVAWMRIGSDGRLWAMNPEPGIYGVAPGTNAEINPNAMAMLNHNTLFTNTALAPNNTPWWEGLSYGTKPEGIINWRGEVWDQGMGPASHPNARYTAPFRQCPSISPHWEDAQGVPISAILFGGRRSRLTPLVYQTFSWEQGVFTGATIASETTAAATGSVGVIRRDPMAMRPFCGYNIAEYFAHWLDIGRRLTNPPLIFAVNWWRRDEDGRFLWPGFDQNVRVLKWIVERVQGKGDSVETPIGLMPTPQAIDLSELGLSEDSKKKLLAVDRDEWRSESEDIEAFLAEIDKASRLPSALYGELFRLRSRLNRSLR